MGYSHVYNNFYKIPVGLLYEKNEKTPSMSPSIYICIHTLYSVLTLRYCSRVKLLKQSTDLKLQQYRPVYFERFKYVGKGFKLIIKRKKKFLNCVFGHSHIYWVKFQSISIKKTKKYKYMFVGSSRILFITMINILKKIKPINRYTLRGVRTYTHAWVKRKGRKSIATHI
jgi:hypothetical protein